MTLKLQIISIAFSLGLLVLIFELVRRKLLKENYSLTWFFVAGGFLLLSVFGNQLDLAANFFGFIQASNAVIVYAVFLILIILLGLSVAITRITNITQTLTQDVGLLKNRFKEDFGEEDNDKR